MRYYVKNLSTATLSIQNIGALVPGADITVDIPADSVVETEVELTTLSATGKVAWGNLDAGAAASVSNFPSTLYVETTGDDANPGTVDRPFRTIQKAIDAVPKGLKKPVTIQVGAGDFDGFVCGVKNFDVSSDGTTGGAQGTVL